MRRPVYVTRRLSFCAAHRYHNPSWSPEKNREVFGPCNNPFGHGHNYELEVTVVGEVDPDTGMVLNLSEIAEILHEEVFVRFDHRHISEEVPEFESRVPTTENLAIDIWNRVAPRLDRPNARLHRVRLYESPDLFSDYFGADASPGERRQS